jgi:hypothetical protein
MIPTPNGTAAASEGLKPIKAGPLPTAPFSVPATNAASSMSTANAAPTHGRGHTRASTTSASAAPPPAAASAVIAPWTLPIAASNNSATLANAMSRAIKDCTSARIRPFFPVAFT